MREVVVVCKGQTEEVFVNEILAPVLGEGNVFLSPRLISTSRHSQGGALNAQRVLRFLRNTLRERRNTYVTTLFDLLRPRYNKVRHGRAVSARIGIDRMRAECAHFDDWMARVEALPPLRPCA